MMIKFKLSIIVFLFGLSSVYARLDINVSPQLLDDYKKFSLAKCIENNYGKMGVVFDKLPLKDNTTGFIDMDIGLAFYRDKNNVLASFIENKTGGFYKPKQNRGDLASANIVIYECIDFYHSRELSVFLRKIISDRIIDDRKRVVDDKNDLLK